MEIIRKLTTRIKKHKVLTAAVLLLIVTGTIATVAFGQNSASKGNGDAAYETTTIKEMDLSQDLTLSGTVESSGTFAVTSPITEVEIASIEVKEGDRVSEGDVIAVLDDAQMLASRSAAQQTYDNAVKRNSADISVAKRNYNNAKQDKRIKNERGKSEVKYAKSQCSKAAADLASRKNQYASALSDIAALENKIKAETDPLIIEELKESLKEAVERSERLASEVREAEDALDAANQALRKAKEEKADESLAQSRNVVEQKDALKAARLTAKESLNAPREELRKANKDLSECIVVSEVDGVVTSVAAKPGDMYKGEAIAIIDDDSNYRVRATVDQYDISSLAEGQDADITIKAAGMEDTWGRLVHVAKTPIVSSGGESSDKTNGGYLVEVLINEPGDKLRIGMTAKVVVKVWEKPNCLAVPDECVQIDENGNRYVEVLDEKERIEKKEVKYGMKTDYYSEIKGRDIEAGMKVIIPAADEFEMTEEEIY